MPEIGSHRTHTTPTVSPSRRAFPELTFRLAHFTGSTRAKLARSLVHALRGRRASPSGLNEAVAEGCRELRATGLSDADIMTFFSALVEEAGLACGADRPSLISGQLRWVPIRARVLDLVRDALASSTSEPFLLMDHRNGPR
jgi:uncharacterized protein YbjT (DUF2867 family)